jgi:beta-lactamase class D
MPWAESHFHYGQLQIGTCKEPGMRKLAGRSLQISPKQQTSVIARIASSFLASWF